jgi:hypothetical protein
MCLMYRIIHKSVKHFKNSQLIYYASNHGDSYADRERISPSLLKARAYSFHGFPLEDSSSKYGIH